MLTVLPGQQNDSYIALTAMLDDPTYSPGQFIRTYTFKKVADQSGWDPTPCWPKRRRGVPAGPQARPSLVVFGLAVSAQQRVTTPAASEWQTYNHDLAGTRFSPLTEINTGNVSTLAKTWTYQFPAPPGGGRGGSLGAASEAVPIVVGGVMYLPVGNTVVALEADTGK